VLAHELVIPSRPDQALDKHFCTVCYKNFRNVNVIVLSAKLMLVAMNNYVSGKTEAVETAIEPAKQTSRAELSSKQCLLHGERLVVAGRMHFPLDVSVSPYTLWDEICTEYYYPGLRGTSAFKH
jgi:hypothetical protein